MSRRALLTRAGVAAVAAAGAGVLLSPREARAATVQGDGRPGVLGILTAGGGAGVEGETGSGVDGYGVRGWGRGADYAGVYGSNAEGNGVVGASGFDTGKAGVRGVGDDGVVGISLREGWSGVYGRHTGILAGPGVTGDGRGNWPGVWGRNPDADGVTGESGGTGFSGVFGRHNGATGYGVTGIGKGAAGFGVVGKNFDAGGTGVLGEGATGVRGTGTGGYGGQFQGGKAQLRIVPKASAGRPTTGNHAKGEIYMDSAANLWVCTANGTPGTWRRVTTTG